MGQLVDGRWSTENVLVQHDDKGLYFKRDSVFRKRISGEAQSEFPANPADITFTAPSLVRGLIAPR
jgi:glutathionyl-hydroquinone reductase